MTHGKEHLKVDLEPIKPIKLFDIQIHELYLKFAKKGEKT